MAERTRSPIEPTRRTTMNPDKLTAQHEHEDAGLFKPKEVRDAQELVNLSDEDFTKFIDYARARIRHAREQKRGAEKGTELSERRAIFSRTLTEQNSPNLYNLIRDGANSLGDRIGIKPDGIKQRITGTVPAIILLPGEAVYEAASATPFVGTGREWRRKLRDKINLKGRVEALGKRLVSEEKRESLKTKVSNLRSIWAEGKQALQSDDEDGVLTEIGKSLGRIEQKIVEFPANFVVNNTKRWGHDAPRYLVLDHLKREIDKEKGDRLIVMRRRIELILGGAALVTLSMAGEAVFDDEGNEAKQAYVQQYIEPQLWQPEAPEPELPVGSYDNILPTVEPQVTEENSDWSIETEGSANRIIVDGLPVSTYNSDNTTLESIDVNDEHTMVEITYLTSDSRIREKRVKTPNGDGTFSWTVAGREPTQLGN